MLQINNVSKTFHETLFSKVSFRLTGNTKAGLVGLNGCGKSTLLKIIAGQLDPDEGTVNAYDRQIKYLPQEISLGPVQMVGEYLEQLVDDPSTEMYIVNRILSRLAAENIDPYLQTDQISDGQTMKLYLVKLLLDAERASYGKSPILLLDEPTNHLDIRGIQWLQSFIGSYPAEMIIISHDREFLNEAVDKIIEIDEKTAFVYEGNYDSFVSAKAHRLEERAKAYHLQEQKRKKLERLLKNSRTIAGGRQRGRAVRAAKRRMEREVTANEIQKYKKFALDGLTLTGNVHKHKKMLTVEGLSFKYPGSEEYILHDVNMELWGGEKIWLYGPNGIGKTTLIKLLIGQLTPDAGNIKWGENISYAYFSQNQSHLAMDQKVADYFREQTGVPYEKSFGVLDKFLFNNTLRDYIIRELSPGQRARLSFAIFTQKQNDFLILDEPTNHLDIETKEVIENALREFSGNILLISHDRYFVREVQPNRALTIDETRSLSSDPGL